MPVDSTAFGRDPQGALGRLQSAVCGGLLTAVALLFLTTQLGIELRQMGSSLGKWLFIGAWSIVGTGTFLAPRRWPSLALTLWLSAALGLGAAVFHSWENQSLEPFDIALAGLSLAVALLGLYLLRGTLYR